MQKLDQVVLHVHWLAGSDDSSGEQVRYHIVPTWGEVKLEIVLLEAICPSVQSEQSDLYPRWTSRL